MRATGVPPSSAHRPALGGTAAEGYHPLATGVAGGRGKRKIENNTIHLSLTLCLFPQMESTHWDNISEPAKDLIQRMLTTEPNHRITIQEVLNHKWLRVSVTGASPSILVRRTVCYTPLVKFAENK